MPSIAICSCSRINCHRTALLLTCIAARRWGGGGGRETAFSALSEEAIGRVGADQNSPIQKGCLYDANRR